MIRRLVALTSFAFACHVSATAWGNPQPQVEKVAADLRNALIIEVVSTSSGAKYKYNGKELSRDVLLAKLNRLRNVDKEGRLWIHLKTQTDKSDPTIRDLETDLIATGFRTVLVEVSSGGDRSSSDGSAAQGRRGDSSAAQAASE